MVQNITDVLLEKIDEKQNPCIVGLDPRIDQIPEHVLDNSQRRYGNTFEAVRDAIIEFNTLIIRAIYDTVPAVKLQMAFYEKYGPQGLEAFLRTARFAKEHRLVVIEDAKRNDIGNTAQAYAEGHLGLVSLIDGFAPSLDVDMMTVNPYLGSDGIRPFIEVCKERGKGIFLLDKTSNKSSGDLQDRIVSVERKLKVYELIARFIHNLGQEQELVGERGYSSVGAVVGATYPDEAKSLREIMPRTLFLVPGYGEQGGTALDVVPCFNPDGYGAVINSSRGIIYAYKKDPNLHPEEFAVSARNAALKMRHEVVSALRQHQRIPSHWKS